METNDRGPAVVRIEGGPTYYCDLESIERVRADYGYGSDLSEWVIAMIHDEAWRRLVRIFYGRAAGDCFVVTQVQ